MCAIYDNKTGLESSSLWKEHLRRQFITKIVIAKMLTSRGRNMINTYLYCVDCCKSLLRHCYFLLLGGVQPDVIYCEPLLGKQSCHKYRTRQALSCLCLYSQARRWPFETLDWLNPLGRSAGVLLGQARKESFASIFTVRRYALHGICYSNSVRPSVRPSVCLSHSWTVSTWFDLRSWFLYHRVAPSF